MGDLSSPSGMMRFLVNGGENSNQRMPMGEGQEAFRRVAEWERQIESLDQKEMELHQSQMKLVRKQTTTFIRDLSIVRQEVASLKARQDAIDAELLGALDSKHQEAKDRHDALHGRLLLFEREMPNHRGDLNDLKTLVKDKLHQDVDKKLAMHKQMADDLLTQRLEESMSKLDIHHGSVSQRLDNLAKDVEIMVLVSRQVTTLDKDVQERVTYLERLIGDSNVKLEQMHGRVTVCERSGSALEVLKKAHDDLASGKAELEVHHASMHERIQYIESVIGDSADKHARELDALKAAHDKHNQALAKHAKGCRDLEGSIAERLDNLENNQTESASKTMQELLAAHQKIDNMYTRFVAVKDAWRTPPSTSR